MSQGFFDGMNSKASFSIGLIGGLGVAFAVGFFILLGQVAGDGSGGKIGGSERDTVAQAPSEPQPTHEAPSGTAPEVSKDDHISGSSNAKVTIIEFSDIQCPFCNRFHPTVKRIREEYGDDVAWVYKHFPLDSIHPQARTAAEASECLADQEGDEAFFAYLDALFAQQHGLGRDLYVAEATKLGANEAEFTDCLDTGKFKDRVNTDYQAGISAGVRGTPASFINGQLISGAQPYEQVKALVDAAL